MAKISTRADDGDKHTLDVTCLLFHQNKLYSAADDGKIKLWQDDLKLLGQVDAHPRSVFSLAASDDTLYSCSNAGTVKSWTLDLKEKSTVFKEECEFWKLRFANGMLYVGDDQGVVRLFEKDQLHNMLNILESVKDMFVSNNLIYTCRDLDLVITEICPGEKGNFVTKKTVPGRAPFNVVGDKIFISSRGGKDIVLYENDGDYKQLGEVKDAHTMIINALCSVKTPNKLLLYSGGWDKVVKQWVVEGDSIKLVNECLMDMCVNCLIPGPKGEIYAGGSDGHIVRIDV